MPGRGVAAFDWLPHDDPAFVARVAAATEAGLARWEAGWALVDPDSPDRVVARPDARLAWVFDYRVFTPART